MICLFNLSIETEVHFIIKYDKLKLNLKKSINHYHKIHYLKSLQSVKICKREYIKLKISDS